MMYVPCMTVWQNMLHLLTGVQNQIPLSPEATYRDWAVVQVDIPSGSLKVSGWCIMNLIKEIIIDSWSDGWVVLALPSTVVPFGIVAIIIVVNGSPHL